MKKNVMKNPAMIFLFIFFVVYALSIIFVILQGIAASFMTPKAFTEKMFPTQAVDFDFANYGKVLSKLVIEIDTGKIINDKMNIIGMFINSLIYAGGTSILGVIFCAITAYITAKYKFPGRNFIYIYSLVTMMLPVVGTGAASIIFFRDVLHVKDTYFMIFMLAGSFGQNYVILFATFKGVSWEYAEAAFIDGAGHFRVFVQVMIPQALSPMFALFMVGFIAKWSDAETSLLYMKNQYTVASGLAQLSVDPDIKNSQPTLFAGFVMSMIPLLLLYLCFQETIMDIQIGGGLKG